MLKVKKAKDLKFKFNKIYTKNFIPIPDNAVTLLASTGGVGKSFLAIQWAIHFILENPHFKVLMWLSEDNEGIIKNRLWSIADMLKLNANQKELIFNNIDFVEDDVRPFPFIVSGGIYKSSEEFLRLKQETAAYKMIVIDPLKYFYSGQENDNSLAGAFMQALSDWAMEYKKVILILHHTSKPVNGNSETIRGASAFRDNCRCAYLMRNIQEFGIHSREIINVKDNWGVRQYIQPDEENKFSIIKQIIPDNFVKVINETEKLNPETIKVDVSISKDITKNFIPKTVTLQEFKKIVSNKESINYSASIFVDGYRKQDNVILGKQNVIILDIDDGLSLELAKTIFSPFIGFIATTKSHQKEKHGIICDRFRVILPCKTIKLTQKEYALMMREICNYYNADVAAGVDIARFYYPNPNAKIYDLNGDTLFDWEYFYQNAIKKQQVIIEKSKKLEIKKNGDSIERAVEKFFENHFYKGNRNCAMFRAIKWLQDENIPENKIIDLLTTLNNSAADPLPQKELNFLFRYHLHC